MRRPAKPRPRRRRFFFLPQGTKNAPLHAHRPQEKDYHHYYPPPENCCPSHHICLCCPPAHADAQDCDQAQTCSAAFYSHQETYYPLLVTFVSQFNVIHTPNKA